MTLVEKIQKSSGKTKERLLEEVKKFFDLSKNQEIGNGGTFKNTFQLFKEINNISFVKAVTPTKLQKLQDEFELAEKVGNETLSRNVKHFLIGKVVAKVDKLIPRENQTDVLEDVFHTTAKNLQNSLKGVVDV